MLAPTLHLISTGTPRGKGESPSKNGKSALHCNDLRCRVDHDGLGMLGLLGNRFAQLLQTREMRRDRLPGQPDRLVDGLTLRNASGKSRDRYGIASFLGLRVQDDREAMLFHSSLLRSSTVKPAWSSTLVRTLGLIIAAACSATVTGPDLLGCFSCG